MAYRGEDLDLRTPQGWSSSGRDQLGTEPNWWTRSTIYKGGRSDPIWVDDIVMACCNRAYDLAAAHRSPEVRLEHLINALTLSDAAAQVLEGRGLSVASLRRESGAAIANDIPVASGEGAVSPTRSEALVEALRLAADQAYPRRTPVTVEDLLHVLVGMKRELPGVQLLYRHSSGWSGRNGADLRLDPLPHLARPAPAQPQRPRYASQHAHDYFSSAPSREQPSREIPSREAPMRDVSYSGMAPGRDIPPPATVVDSFQDSRLDSLERAVRDLGVDLSDDRKAIRNLMGELQRASMAQADDTGRFRGSLSERLMALEDVMLRMRSETQQAPSALIDRLSMLERSLGDFKDATHLSPVLTDRLADLERGLDQRMSEMIRINTLLVDRLEQLETVSRRPVEAAIPASVTHRLEAVSAVSDKLDVLERTFQLILDRMTGVERHLGEVASTKVDLTPVEGLQKGILAKVQALAEKEPNLAPVTDLLAEIEAKLASVSQSVDNRTAETGRTVSFVGERLRAFEEQLGGQGTKTIDRIGQIERSLAAYAESTVAAGATQREDITELHEALVKLNTNQQTLAGALEQWRQDNIGDLSIINNRLKQIEDTEQKQNPMVDNLGVQIAALHAALVKKEQRKSRFRHWLFGTDEWYSASYHTKVWRAKQIADEALPAKLAAAARDRTAAASPPPPLRAS